MTHSEYILQFVMYTKWLESSGYISVSNIEGIQVLRCIRPKSQDEFLPESIPKDLSPRFLRFHGHPYAWWMGQFLKYMTKPMGELRADIENMSHKMGFLNPIVG